MENFVYDVTTKVHFGKGQVENLGAAVAQRGKKALLVYGGGSVKKIGLYNQVIAQFTKHGITWVELGGVEPNPRVTSVEEGARLCRDNQLEVVVAIGGGSTIDCAKVIAAAVSHDGKAWDLVTRKQPIKSVLPVFSVLTLSATGSEMNNGAVISNMETNDKMGIGHRDMMPVCSILDPTYTFTVSPYQTAAGTADIMSHIFEAYFSPVETAYLQDRMAEAMLKTCIRYGRVAMDNPEDYEARANLMWTSSLAINGLLSLGKAVPWSVHGIEHQLSAYYDITHGVGLAILTPAWMEYVLSDKTVHRFAEYGRNVWDIPAALGEWEIARQAIDKTRQFFASLGIPATLREVGIDNKLFDVMAAKAATPGLANAFVPLGKDDVVKIYEACL